VSIGRDLHARPSKVFPDFLYAYVILDTACDLCSNEDRYSRYILGEQVFCARCAREFQDKLNRLRGRNDAANTPF
jgi:hypothetical protein